MAKRDSCVFNSGQDSSVAKLPQNDKVPNTPLMWFDRSDFVVTLDLWSELTMSGVEGNERDEQV